jgi:hypothetical protein
MSASKLLMKHEIECLRKHNDEPYAIIFCTWEVPNGRYWIYELDKIWMERTPMPEPRLVQGIQRKYCLS